MRKLLAPIAAHATLAVRAERSRSTALLLSPLLACALTACTVGPHATTNVPLPPIRTAETITPVNGPAQHITIGTPVPQEWWQAFASPKLNALVTETLAHNNDLATADATWRQAREQSRSVAGQQAPAIDANYQAQRARIARVLATPLFDPDNYLYTLHTAQVTVAYPLDLFGAGRNKVRSSRAAAEVARHRLAAARTTVVANLVLATIQHAALEAEVAATRNAIQSNRELVDLLQKRRQLGDVGEADVAAQATALATVEASLPPLERQLRHQTSLITTLLGQPAGSPAPDLPSLAELTLPADLPLGLPAEIVANRPDVAAAEAQMRGAAADVGTAIAARLPAIQLTGTFGGTATQFADMFASGNPFYTLLGSVTQPIFHAGALLHQQHAALAALEAAKSQYRAAALQAFLDVDDALSGLKTDAAALDAATRADTAATRSLMMMRRQVELGAQGTLALLTASSAASQASVQLVAASAARLTDTVALFQAAGTDVRRR
jgi:NodT family efflux transporter outer membrane factor (OMF) lipoprotein